MSFKGERNTNPRSFEPDAKPMVGPVTIEADLTGDELHVVHTSGDTKKEHNGKRSAVDAEKLGWSMAQLAVIGPLLDSNLALAGTAAGAGSQKPAGTDTIDGRTAERFELAPAGALDVSGKAAEGVVRGLMGIRNVTGTIWVDQETGALLKMDITYDTGDRKGNAWKQHDVIVVTGLKKR